jgi:ABC-type branched-subunit amino acid transport system substrate-binding protein
MFPNPQNHSGRNPYIIGNPIGNKEQLFGRETLLTTIKDSLQQNIKFILLHGQRRVGKSSVLRNIPLFVSEDEYVFVPCDFQVHAYATLGEIFHAIAMDIFQLLDLDTSILQALSNADSINIRRILNNKVLPQIYEKLDNKKLVLLLDEFDVVTQNDTKQAVEFLHLLEDLVRRQDELFVIAVVGRYLDSMPDLVQSFRDGISQEIGLLDSESTKQLITKPANDILQYKQKAIEEILKFSAGHPYYTQVLCHTIFNQANNETYSTVIPACVTDAVKQTIEHAEGGLASIWHGLGISEKVVILAVAEAQNSHTIENPLKLLESYGLVLTKSLEEAIQILINKGFLNSNPVKVKVELVRLWLLQRHSLRDEIRSLETLEEEDVNQLLFVARRCWMADKQKHVALGVYEQALKLNPNHLSTIVELAEKYLHLENFEEALKLSERGYKLDSIRYQQQLIQVLDQYGHRLITQEDYERAKQQYEKILTIEPENSLAKQNLASIKTIQDNKNNINTSKPRQIVRLPIPILLLFLISIFGSLFAGIQVFSSCPAGQEKKLGIFCKDVIYSRGDRTLFSDIQNSDRDKGIESFKKGNYLEAEDYFKLAFNNNPPDPEVLIYQNNALARQKGNPLTLAAVVPATNRIDLAIGMLRGIGQAQHEFNQKGGFKGRLLEIVIADDESEVETAKLVAEKIVENQSLLGIIGHSSSNITEAVLNTYKKAKLAVISPTSSSTQLRQNNFFFRTLPSDEVTGKEIAEYAFKHQVKKVIIFCQPKDTYSESIREAFKTAFENKPINGEIFEKPCIDMTSNDLTEEKIKTLLFETQPEGILLFPNTRNVAAAIKIIKAHKQWLNHINSQTKKPQQTLLLGGATLENAQILQEGDAVEGLVIAVPWFRNSLKSINFAQKSKKLWGDNIAWHTASSFDATQAFIESFKPSSNISKVTVLENLPNVKLSENNTSGEELVFDKNREMKRNEKLLMVKNGKFIVIP